MDTRRSFLKKAGLLTGAAGAWYALPPTLQKALAIDPAPGSTFYDAEHIVFLMQENRSFDHAFGTLQGVRGFNDPRAITLANNNKVWLQSNRNGDTYAPFHLDIKDSKITWMGCLPHGWDNQVDARNGGRFDKWIEVKDPGDEFEDMPLTMGYYNRADIPFYYALADAFTVCDQHFCSSLTGTTPNRLYFWTGTIRAQMEAAAQANVWNENAEHHTLVDWKTYPERLEENGISWKVYQNEIYADTGLDEAQPWLDNFGDNPLEYFKRYHVNLAPEVIAHLPVKLQKLEKDIQDIETRLATAKETEVHKHEILKMRRLLKWKKKQLAATQKAIATDTAEAYQNLSSLEKNLHTKAFTNNRNDSNYHQLTKIQYNDGNVQRQMDIPKGDVLHQFRQDVKNGQLPTVSWLCAPQHFSDHPDSPWFGAWYVSEVMDILTQNPEVWKKTIFVLTYDENDGYFDHVPPFGAPNPYMPGTGKVSAGIDTSVEFVRRNEQSSARGMRESNIGLGFRVPMVVASPWTRGGYVCSEVFDHTSSLQFLETFLEKKTGKKITESNITQWRRTVCGNLTSVFRPYSGQKIETPPFVDKEAFIQLINNAQFKNLPGYKKLTEDEIAAVNNGAAASPLPRQEKGIRPACALPYELYVNGNLNKAAGKFNISFKAGNKLFGQSSAGAPFYVYSLSAYQRQVLTSRDYAVTAGDELQDEWALGNFDNGNYHLAVYGPNGFYRMFKGNTEDPLLHITCGYEKNKVTGKFTGNVMFSIRNNGSKPITVTLADNSYKTGSKTKSIAANSKAEVVFNLSGSFGWYDVSITANGYDAFKKQFAGRVETGDVSRTDPLMGGVV